MARRTRYIVATAIALAACVALALAPLNETAIGSCAAAIGFAAFAWAGN